MNDYEKLLYKSNRQKHQLKILQDKCHKYKEVIDKIKEYCKNTINRYEDYIGKEDIVRENKFILELLEEIE